MSSLTDTEGIIGERLRDFRTSLGESQSSAARTIGISPAAWRKYEVGNSHPSMESLQLMVSEMDLNPYWLLTGKGDMRLSDEALNDEEPRPATTEGALRTIDDEVAAELKDLGIRLVWVPNVRVEASAGAGYVVHTEDELEEGGVWMSETYIRREYGVAPQRIRSMKVRGDSMIDTINPGERVRVALHDGDRLRDSAIYVISTPTGLVVKRLVLGATHIVLASDNPAKDDWEVEPEEWEKFRPVALVLEVIRPL